ncbi:hypothetical protein HK405_012426 [Cladochytrium tenue]|nr:hypothetical protein HK405_012426 [Cladochytrium tenue]
MALRDPTPLFDSPEFTRSGALFWPDFMSRRRDSVLWDLFGIAPPLLTPPPPQAGTGGAERLELESGQILVDKRRVWKGLKMAEHISSEGRFYFKHFWGDKETFYWGFRAAGLPVAVSPHYIHLVGRIVSPQHPRGTGRLLEAAAPATAVDGAQSRSPQPQLPPDAVLCGQSMLQRDWDGEPAFLHWNGVKASYDSNVDPFVVARTYVARSDAAAADAGVQPAPGPLAAPNVGFVPLGTVQQLHRCVDLPPRGDLELRTWDFSATMPGLNELFHRVRREAYSDDWRTRRPDQQVAPVAPPRIPFQGLSP